MTNLEVSFAGILFLVVLLALIAICAAYRNGVTDGYGYSKEPNCPGYQHAGWYLRTFMAHRWPELTHTPEQVRYDERRGSMAFIQDTIAAAMKERVSVIGC